MSIQIKNKFLKEQFKAFQKAGTEEEKIAFLKEYEVVFETLNHEEKANTRQDWLTNLEATRNRFQTIKEELETSQKSIKVLPKDKEEQELVAILLKKMNIQFELV